MALTPITDREVFDAIRKLGLQVAKNKGEWRIRIPGKPEADYFTDDGIDALGTARKMAANTAEGIKRYFILGDAYAIAPHLRDMGYKATAEETHFREPKQGYYLTTTAPIDVVRSLAVQEA